MLSSSELRDKIVEKAKSIGASITGVTSIESLKNSPSHKIYSKIGMNLDKNFADPKDDNNNVNIFWPEDAVSAVIIGIAHNINEPELDWWDGKGTLGNRILIKVNNQLSEWIEKTFSVKTYKLPYFVEKGGIFLKDAAVYAGLGCIGKNNLVITPEYGPRIRFRGLLLNKEAKPTDSPEFNPCEKCGQPCRKACPVKAFQNTVYSPKDLAWAVQNRLKNFFGIWSPPSLLAVTAALETLKAGRLQEKRPLDPAFLLGHTILGNNLKRLCFLHFFDGFWNLESSSIRPPDDPKSKIPGCRDSVKPRASV